MTYPFVKAGAPDYGPRRGPALGLMFHMAEGANTVAYLSRNPPRGVSVHAVCDIRGVVTQMLAWDAASGSLNPADRSTDKAYFGRHHLVDVLGSWSTDPNSAVLSMEIEGFASRGPSPAQRVAAIAWGRDMVARFPSIRGALGHADQTNTKACPGTTRAMQLIFEGVGGHGLWHPQSAPSQGAPMHNFALRPGPIGSLVVKGPGHWYMSLADGVMHGPIVPATFGVRSPAYPVTLIPPLPGAGDRATGYLIGTNAAFLLASDVTFTPAPVPAAADCSVQDGKLAAIRATLDR